VESSLYEFGSFTVQPDERLLLREGRPVSLTPKAFDLLIQLIERPGQLVGKQELMTALWPETFVEEANLAYTMSALRRALGDGQDGNQFIQTVPTRGYRFVSPVTRNEPTASITADRVPTGVAGPRRRFPAIAVAAVAIAGLGGLFIGLWAPWRDAVSTPSMQLSIELGAPVTLPTTREAFALSADGTLLAFAARERENEAERLYVRRLGEPTATLIPGTEGASSPFFSPDAQWVAFFADFKLRKVPVTGGVVRTLADALNHRGGWWGEDQTIVFARSGRTGLMRVSSDGGPVQPLTTLLDGEISHRFPQVLPGGKAVLYTASTEVDIGTGASLVVQPLPSGDRVVVQPHGFFGRYTPSGHIVYMQDSALFAVPFDRQRLRILGPPRRVINGVTSDSSRGSAQFAVSEAGTLAYLPGQNLFDARPIAWMDRQGTMTSLHAVPTHWSNAEFSPDGESIAMDIRRDGHTDIFVYELARGTLIPVTSGGGDEEYPVWTRDGKRIVYRSFTPSSNPPYTLSWKRADGTGEAQILTQSTGTVWPGSWHPTQNVLAFVAERPGTGPDVMLLRVEGDETSGWKPGQPSPFLESASREMKPVFSHDGKWLAYDSNESGREGVGSHDVYVRPFPGPGHRVMVSSGGGERPSWSPSTGELVFTVPSRDYRRLLMVAPYRVEKGTIRFDKPRQWEAKGVPLRILEGHRSYALNPDGARVAIPPLSDAEKAGQTHVTLFLNVFDHLRRIAPGQ
jgi:serine/threonine-protein kinase